MTKPLPSRPRSGLDDAAIAGGFDDAAVMQGDGRIDEVSAQRRNRRRRTLQAPLTLAQRPAAIAPCRSDLFQAITGTRKLKVNRRLGLGPITGKPPNRCASNAWTVGFRRTVTTGEAEVFCA
jgi:hypothetical protein